MSANTAALKEANTQASESRRKMQSLEVQLQSLTGTVSPSEHLEGAVHFWTCFSLFLLAFSTESIFRRNSSRNEAALRHAGGAMQWHHCHERSWTQTAARWHPKPDPAVSGPAKHQDEAGGWDSHLQETPGWRRLNVSDSCLMHFVFGTSVLFNSPKSWIDVKPIF